jgi:outer membrane receptor protein involved in Fe transport
MRWVTRLAITGLLAAGGTAHADDDRPLEELTLEELLAIEIEVSSTVPEDTFSIPSTVSVIDRATIELYGFTSIPEALSTLAGVTIHRTFETRDIPVIRGILQDHSADKVLILIDGVPSWMAVNGHGTINTLDIGDIERIEVLRGPASVLYGTNAYSGAINLVLRKDEDGTSRARARIGTGGHLAAGATATTELHGITWMVSANGSHEEGQGYAPPPGDDCEHFLDERGECGELDDFDEGNNLVLKGSWDGGRRGDHEVLVAAHQRRESYLGAVPDFQHGAGNPLERYGYVAHWGATFALGDRVDLTPGLTFDWKRRESSRIEDDSVRTRSIGHRTLGSLRARIAATPWLDVDLGGDVEYRRATMHADFDTMTGTYLVDNNMTGQHVTEGAVVAQAEVRGDRFAKPRPARLLLGARYTRNELFAGNLSLRGTVVYKVAARQSVKLVAGQSFRAPTLFELYFQTPFATESIQGNPDLEPETSDSLEVSYQLARGPLYLQALAYHARYDDKIFLVRLDPDDPNDRSLGYVNGAPFSAWGAELEARVQSSLASAFLTYAYVRGDDGDEDASNPGHYNFKYVPRHTANLGVAKTLDAFTVTSRLQVIGRRGSPGASLDPQLTWDATLSYRTDATLHTLSFKNIYDDQLLIPDYVRRNLDAYSSGYGRQILYSLEVELP